MKLSLDTNAIRSLMFSDPEFAVELKRAVIQNIISDISKVTISQELTQIIQAEILNHQQDFLAELREKEAFNNALRDALADLVSKPSQTSSMVLTPATMNMVQKEVSRVVDTAITTAANNQLSEHPEKIKKYVEENIEIFEGILNDLPNYMEKVWKQKAYASIKFKIHETLRAATAELMVE